MSLSIETNRIVVGEFDALGLLSPDIHPLTERLQASAAEQADQIIRDDVEGLREEYHDGIAQGLRNFQPRYRRGTEFTIADAAFELLDTRALYRRFLKHGEITTATRHGLFCERPDYDWNETSFEFPFDFAGDLVPYFKDLHKKEIIHPQMDVADPAERYWNLDDKRLQWYGRYAGYVAMLSTMADGSEVAAMRVAEYQAPDSTRAYLKDWARVIKRQFN